MIRHQDPDSGAGNPPVPANHLLHGLAILVIIATQAFEVTQDFIRFINSPLWVARPLAWAVLFAIAGRALARSRAGHDLRSFLLQRLARDWAPLACVVVAMALIVGPATTERPTAAYFSDAGTWTYLANLVGLPQFALPGVFELNTESRTTLGLFWSVPAYLALVLAVAVSGDRQRWRRVVLPLTMLITIGLAQLSTSLGLRLMPDSGFSRAEAVGFPQSALLAGLCGALWSPIRLQRFRRRLLFAALVLIVGITGFVADRDLVGSTVTCIGLAAVGNAVLLTRGTRRRDWDPRIRPWMPVIYCTWLVSFPVQQLVAAYGPLGFGAWRNLVLSVPIALATGVVLWRLLAIALVRVGAGPIIGPARLPLGQLSLARYSRRWWLARLRQLLVIGAWSMVLALVAAGLLALALLAFQPDRVGI